jgi:hypothetical protein
MKKLITGDVFEVKKGTRVYAFIPDRFIYQNTPNAKDYSQTEITVGQVIELPGKGGVDEVIKNLLEHIKDCSDFHGVSFDTKKLKEAIRIPPFKSNIFDTSKFIGEYVVVSANMGGGGTGHGLHDIFPDGWHVTAKKLNKGKFDECGEEISFYQSGSFTVVNENIPAIRKMKKTFN